MHVRFLVEFVDTVLAYQHEIFLCIGNYKHGDGAERRGNLSQI
jgi:hypothetical protein